MQTYGEMSEMPQQSRSHWFSYSYVDLQRLLWNVVLESFFHRLAVACLQTCQC